MRRATTAALAITLVAYAVLAYGYITLTPIWQNPDEPAHYNYVAFVAQTGGLPELKQGDWDSALLERLKTGTLLPGDSVASIRYESWQPPLFYLVAAPVFGLGPTADPAAVLCRLRTFDAVLGGLTLIIAYAIAREALASHLALAVPLTMVGIPMFTAVSAGLSADPLANLLSAVLVLVLVRRVRVRCASDRSALTTGVLLGLGVLTKLALGIFLALAVVVISVRSSLREAIIALGTTALVVAPWLVHQVTTYGWADPLAIARHSAVVADQQRFPGLSLDYLIQFATISFHSFWAQFGWMAIVAPAQLYVIWGVLLLLAVAGLATARHRIDEPVWRFLVGSVVVAFLAYVTYNLAFEQFQGRYLFTAIVPIAILLVAGWAAWLPTRLKTPGAMLLALTLVALNAYSLVRVLLPGFAPAS